MRVRNSFFKYLNFILHLATGRNVSKRKRYFDIYIEQYFYCFLLAVQFDKAGRPYHFLYYTAKQNYYDVLHVNKSNFFIYFLLKFSI